MLKRPLERKRLIELIGLGICLMATLLGVWLHAVYLTHAGALWRDEASGVQLATSTDLSVMGGWRRECFPASFSHWCASGRRSAWVQAISPCGSWVSSSAWACWGGLWLNARLMGFRWPFISLGLLAVNLTVVRWGDSLRAYGCGALFILLTLGLIWRLVRAPGRSSFLAASLAAVLSVQTLYHNAVLVLAACIAGWAVCALHRQWKTAALVLGVGLLAAVSLVPYVAPLVQAQDYMALHKMGFELDWVWAALALALGQAWIGHSGLVRAGALGPGGGLGHAAGTGQGYHHRLPGFAGVCGFRACCGHGSFLAFLRLSEFPAQPWYFLPLMAFAAAALDAALANWCRQFRAWASVFVAVMVCAPFPTIS